MEHSRVGASGANRWMNCPASVALTEQNPQPKKSSAYAEEGTKAHELAESMVNARLANKTVNMLPYGPEMVNHVRVYTNEVVDCINNIENPIVQIEAKVNMSYVHPDLFGTVDAVVFDPEDQHLHVFDLKYGEGIMVDPYENAQLLFYANCVWLGYMPRKITSYIVQPRATTGDVIKSWTYDAQRLANFEGEVRDALAWVDTYRNMYVNKSGFALEANHVKPGDHCTFCPALSVCPKHLETFEVMTTAEKVPREKGATSLDDKSLVEILSAEKSLNTWIKELKKIVETRLMNGEAVEGFKLVEKRTNRCWTNEDTVIRKYGKKGMTETVVLSPSKAEKIFDKKELAKYITKPEGQPTMALATDKRKPINPPALELFGDMNE